MISNDNFESRQDYGCYILLIAEGLAKLFLLSFTVKIDFASTTEVFVSM